MMTKEEVSKFSELLEKFIDAFYGDDPDVLFDASMALSNFVEDHDIIETLEKAVQAVQ